MKRVRVKIRNEHGMHARPAAEFVKLARSFKSEIWICKKGERYSATSILEVLSSNLNHGNMLTIEAAGPDEEEALARLSSLMQGWVDKDKSA